MAVARCVGTQFVIGFIVQRTRCALILLGGWNKLVGMLPVYKALGRERTGGARSCPRTEHCGTAALPWLLAGSAFIGMSSLAIPVSCPRAAPAPLECQQPALKIHKRQGVVELYCAETLRGRFLATFGRNPVGPKLQEGDERTPEGHYYVSSRVETPRFYRFLGVSYPNAEDQRRAREFKIMRPGGGIGIHGTKKSLAGLARLWLRAGHLLGLNRLWGPTDGCIGVSNEDIEVLYDAVHVGTPIEITP
jgi:hypothetical protein